MAALSPKILHDPEEHLLRLILSCERLSIVEKKDIDFGVSTPEGILPAGLSRSFNLIHKLVNGLVLHGEFGVAKDPLICDG